MTVILEKIDNHKTINKQLSFGIFFPVFTYMLQLLLYKYFGNIGIIHSLIVVLTAIPYVLCIKIWVKKNPLGSFMIYGITTFVFLLQAILFPENLAYITNDLLPIYCICIPCCINESMIDDEKVHVSMMHYLAMAVFVTGEIYLLLSVSQGSIQSGYSMSYTYYMLFAALYFAYKYFSDNRMFYLLLSLVSLISMIILGSRGAVVSWAIFFIIEFITMRNGKIKKIFILSCGVFVCIKYELILNWSTSILKNLGISSRTLFLMQTGELLTHDSGRSQIRDKTIEIIKDNLFFGAGIGSDSRLLGTYSHNLFLDIFLHFGVLFGCIIIFGLIVLIITTFIRSKDRSMFMLLFCYGFVPIMVSGTYLSYTAFWIFLGYCIRNTRYRLVWNKYRGK